MSARISRNLAIRAAVEIGRSAREMRRAHTVNGKWPREDREIQLYYIQLCALRRELYEACK